MNGLDADLDRWAAGWPRVAVPATTRPVEPFLARLPPAAATALAAFDSRVRSGTMPQFGDTYDWSYGFDFAANDCEILDSDYETALSDEDVWSIGADGGGNLHVVLTNGRVAVWFHEEQVIEEHTQFASLDVFVWSVLRLEAVRAGVLDRVGVAADFQALEKAGALQTSVGVLHYL
ncbi:hypothetical protein GCM10009682_26150 [Luedemannella flava]|uniref:SMI1/KNR4 family protein n=1 Tax=Luedemannella flava TaxID=349316 RepID=A0ABP4Y3Y9_9ACTN